MLIYDMIGVGFGPANIALAISLEEGSFEGKYLFIERNAHASWQSNMLLDGSDIQNHPLRDLVTPANPRSFYSFTNYLFVHKRLFDFLNLGIVHPMRREYADYIVWAASHFDGVVSYGEEVIKITAAVLPDGTNGFVVTSDSRELYAKSLVVAPGRSLRVPQVFERHLGDRVFHLTSYEARLRALEESGALQGDVVVIGASQSAAEIVLDLEHRYPNLRVNSVMRSFGFRQKDTSPFSEEVYFPEFVDYFYNATPEVKQQLNRELNATNYSSVDSDVIHKLYLKLYMNRFDGSDRIKMHRNKTIESCDARGVGYHLILRDRGTRELSEIEASAIVLATGFRNFGSSSAEEISHPILDSVRGLYEQTSTGTFVIARDYALVRKDARTAGGYLYVNGLCEATHGLGDAGSFSLLSLRAQEIRDSLAHALSKMHASVTRRIASVA
ncbi:lysine N(6)-hydroxylase/L-ornithine N(5)-oxygenase family protein [Paraburkholderia caribensis]|uniref:lysine N(6)-hydroxylase/L-ornithine N(5)-oxygenase family protein n=1 Tax=Paraburkholderia caribensis TaxID=75105 RepID=UPI00078C7265|nr:SidA/IucD/PvdA family monooxygenase [Paraburkholderia caribensis]AMV41758.1 hypothetical protein ATN79_03545 [Paraburkholderia caribensis]